MSEVTTQDIHEVHQRIDKMVDHQNQTNIELAEIKTTLKLLPKPDPEPRPCHYHEEVRADLDEHLESHAETKRLWRTPIIKAAIDLAKMTAVALAAFWYANKKG